MVDKSLRLLVVILSLFSIWVVISNVRNVSIINKNNNYVVDSLQHVVDSLHAENYPCQIELNRYQMAYKIFLTQNPNAAKQYGDIISNETE
jgi:hypothetical protein